MNVIDICIILLIAVLVVMAWRSAHRKGGCGCGCNGCEKCGGSCGTEKKE